MSNLVSSNSISLELTQQSLQALTEQRNLLKVFIEKQLVQGVDYGILPGTPKPSLYKPGAEKLTNIFKIGSRIIKNEKTIDREKNYAQVDVTVEVYHIASNLPLSTCEGIANSHETKNRYRAKYEWVNGKKIKVGEIETPIGDLLNTLSKMAQKRGLVGAVILATNASDFFTQDLEDMPDIIFETKDVTPKQAEKTTYQPKPKEEVQPQATSTVNNTPQNSHFQDSAPGDHVVSFGKFKGQAIKDIHPDDIDNYIKYLESNAAKANKPLTNGVLAFVTEGKKFLTELAGEINF